MKNTRSPESFLGAAPNIRVTGLFVCMQNTALKRASWHNLKPTSAAIPRCMRLFLHVSMSTADHYWRHPAGVEHHHMHVRLRFCCVGGR
jgi:hypothetical protein